MLNKDGTPIDRTSIRTGGIPLEEKPLEKARGFKCSPYGDFAATKDQIRALVDAQLDPLKIVQDVWGSDFLWSQDAVIELWVVVEQIAEDAESSNKGLSTIIHGYMSRIEAIVKASLEKKNAPKIVLTPADEERFKKMEARYIAMWNVWSDDGNEELVTPFIAKDEADKRIKANMNGWKGKVIKAKDRARRNAAMPKKK